MDVTEAAHLARRLMNHHGLGSWIFSYDGAKQRAGQCSYTNKTISLSRHITALRSEKDVTNTILHEIAHALTPGAGHGPEWVRKAREIGSDGERCYTQKPGEKVPPNWIAICPVGHKVGSRYRRPRKDVNHSCGTCNPAGGYDSRYKIQWVAADIAKAF